MLAENLSLTENDSMNDELMAYAQSLGFGEIHVKFDAAHNLQAIIAIHSTKLGPALGGCRLKEYPTYKDAIKDALRLAQGMSYKAAITGLPLGGGKSVLIKPPHIADRHEYFKTFGRFIEDLGGRYITAVDSGTNTDDMDAIAEVTRYVTSTSAGNGDPSPYTAMGVKRSIDAAVQFKFGKNNLSGLRVAIQGIGHVGHYLLEDLHVAGAQVIIADTSQQAIQACLKKYPVVVVEPSEIHKVDCDIFAPCALGAILNDVTIPQIKASMIVGAANNQLAEARHGEELRKRGILYAPDYVVNAGGLICACAQYYKTPTEEILRQVENIHEVIFEIFERAARENKATSVVADAIAEEKLKT